MAIQVLTTNHPVCFLSVYLPSRSGCTDNFKDCLDYVNAVLGQLSFDSDVYILGDLNADPGSGGGPLATTTANEQGRILARYLRKWNYVAVHLHLNNNPQFSSHTYISEARGTYSSIDHIIFPKHLLSGFSECTVLEEDPLNLSDDLPVC